MTYWLNWINETELNYALCHFFLLCCVPCDVCFVVVVFLFLVVVLFFVHMLRNCNYSWGLSIISASLYCFSDNGEKRVQGGRLYCYLFIFLILHGRFISLFAIIFICILVKKCESIFTLQRIKNKSIGGTCSIRRSTN